MSENDKPRRCSLTSTRLAIVLSVIIVVVCFGWLIHLEVVQRKDKELINTKEAKAGSMASFNCKTREAEARPQVSLPVGPIYVKEGDNMTLSCHVTGSPKPNVTWSKVFDSLPPKRSFLKANKLKVLSVQSQDSGLYVCTGSNTLGSTIESIKIIVVSAPKFITTPPLLVNVCDKLTLECQALGDPPAVIRWSKEKGELPTDSRTQIDNGQLTITGLKASDAGKYVCTAVSAGVATSKSVTTVTVIEGYRILKFARESLKDYILVKRKLPPLARFTVCFWMKPSKSRGNIISYAVPGSDNEIMYNTAWCYIESKKWVSPVPIINGQWQHICATWNNTAGQSAFYQDGVRRSEGTVKKGHVIKGGGSLIIGQEQDTMGGGFDISDSFVGELAGINMWNRVLDPSEISAMSITRNSNTSGNVLTWNDVLSGTKYGQVKIIKSCEP